MTRVDFLEALCRDTRKAVADIMMPVRQQKDDKGVPPPRAAEVYRMRLKNSSAAQKKAPYIIHQVITGKDAQPSGKAAERRTNIRTIFCVYNDESEEEGALMLLNLIERLEIHLLESIVIENRYELDTDAGLEVVIYPDDSAPYYAGEMMSTWKMPAIKRKVNFSDGY